MVLPHTSTHYDKIPEQAKVAIQRAMEVSTKGAEKAVEAVSNVRQEQVQERVNRNLQKVKENAPEEAQQYIPSEVSGGDTGKPEDAGTSQPSINQSGAGQQGGSAPAQVPAGRGR